MVQAPSLHPERWVELLPNLSIVICCSLTGLTDCPPPLPRQTSVVFTYLLANCVFGHRHTLEVGHGRWPFLEKCQATVTEVKENHVRLSECAIPHMPAPPSLHIP